MTIRPSLLRRASWLLSALGVIVAAVVWWMPPNVSAAPLAPAAAVDSPVAPVAIDPAIAEEIAVANLFAASRTPPAKRYSPADAQASSADGMVEPTTIVEAAPADGPRLLGTVVGPAGPMALLQLEPGGTARLYAAGEADAGYRIISIAPRVVVLRGPGGRTTLRLDPEEDRP
ncbi:MAG: hypothetical protein IT361_03635 [Gemmatimonadaceae bacterium]|nr:hypothetical protein [Gemmatimonadaceae bacterium]